jgi:hypothetical protein
MIIYQAVFVTRHFQFEACGATKDEAIEAMTKGLRFHAGQYDLDLDWWMEGFEGVPTDEIFEIHEYEVGVAYRNNQSLRVQ